MKRFFVLAIMASTIISVYSQTKHFFCEIKGMEKDLSSGLNIVFDFGEAPVYGAWGDLKSKQRIVDNQGKEIKFHSMVDAANYVADRGWHFLQAYTSVYGGSAVQHWIFSKEAENKEKAVEGIMTKGAYMKAQETKNN